MEREGCPGVKVLPLDLCSSAAQLHEAATEADNAFDGAGVDYLIHNAGVLPIRPRYSISCLLIWLSPCTEGYQAGLLGVFSALQRRGCNALQYNPASVCWTVKCR